MASCVAWFNEDKIFAAWLVTFAKAPKFIPVTEAATLPNVISTISRTEKKIAHSSDVVYLCVVEGLEFEQGL